MYRDSDQTATIKDWSELKLKKKKKSNVSVSIFGGSGRAMNVHDLLDV
jgi:hypothetical protein